MNNKELDKFVNELFKRQTVTAGAEDFVCKNVRITRQHLPDEFLEILFGEQLFSPGQVKSMSAVELKNIFTPGEEMLGALTKDWMGKQETSSTGVIKQVKRRRNSINPGVADRIRRMLGTAISFAFPMQGLCDGFVEQIRITSQLIRDILEAAGLFFGVASTSTTSVDVEIGPELQASYEKVSSKFYTDPRLNYGRVRNVRPIDYLFFPKITAAISTGSQQTLTLDMVKTDVKEFKRRLDNVKGISATEVIFEDFFERAFAIGKTDVKSLKNLCVVEITKAREKLSTLQLTGLQEIRSAMVSDYVQKADGSLKHTYGLIRALNPPKVSDMLAVFNNTSF